jgi:hypothetical protein
MIPSSPASPPLVERIDDIVQLTFSGLVVADRQETGDEHRPSFDEQFFVEWEVPETV